MTHLHALANIHHDFSVYTEVLRIATIFLAISFQVALGLLIVCPLINTIMSRNWMRRIRRNIYLTRRALGNPTYWIALDDAVCHYVVPMRWLRHWV